jgi:arabinan endo-1,5-alpha-L-arabinosidase
MKSVVGLTLTKILGYFILLACRNIQCLFRLLSNSLSVILFVVCPLTGFEEASKSLPLWSHAKLTYYKLFCIKSSGVGSRSLAMNPILMWVTLLTFTTLAAAQESYTNPVITPVAADPDVIRAEDGTFYLFATQDDWGDGQGDHYLPVFSSLDLVNWEFIGDAFEAPPSWKKGGGFMWAPDISYFKGIYYLYYASSLWGDPNPCIGLATSATPEGSWEDLGGPVFCSKDIGVNNSIDPFVWYENGERTMVWGSWHNIYAVALNEDGTKAVGEKTQLADTRFEAPHIMKRNGFYYLFVSSGSCCEGEFSSYTTWVGRSENLLGPYVDSTERDLRHGGGEVVLHRNDVWVAPGHTSVMTDDAGADWLLYHAISADDPRLPNGVNRRPTLIDKIVWQDGWPIVNRGDGPSSKPQLSPVITPR